MLKIIDGNNPIIDGIIRSKCNIDESIFIAIFMWSQMRSKDPRTKVGAGVYDHTNGSLHLGYNGFPSTMRDIEDIWVCRDRQIKLNKYKYVVHAEMNAITKALISGYDKNNSALYVTHVPCFNCIKDVILPNIKKVKILCDVHDADENIQELMDNGIMVETFYDNEKLIEFKNYLINE